MTRTIVAATLAIAATAVFAMPASAASGKEQRTILSCANVGTNIDLVSRYVQRVKKASVRKSFKAEFEVEHREPGYVAGQEITVSVAGVPVGTAKLGRQLDGTLQAELQLESERKAFPANFPAVPTGTLVEVATKGATVLSCALK